MKKLLYILVCFCGVASAQSLDSLFVKANALYQAEKYQEAITIYEQIAQDEKATDAVFYNLGNAHYKLNNIAPTIYNFEKALQLNPNNESAQNNLTFANRMKIDAIKPLPKTFFQKLANSTYKQWSSNTWSIIAVCASFLVVIAFLLYYFNQASTRKLLFFNVMLFSAIVMLFSVFFAYKVFSSEKTIKQAIVFAKETNIKNAPTNSAETVFKLHEGTKVNILTTKDYWTEISLADGKNGWIATEAIKGL